MRILKIILLFCLLLYLGSFAEGVISLFPYPVHPRNVPGQDPVVEKMLTLGYLAHPTPEEEPLGIGRDLWDALGRRLPSNYNYWRYVKALIELEKQTTNPESKALIAWRIGASLLIPSECANLSPEEMEKFVEVYRKRGIYYPHYYLYDNTLRSYIQDTGRWEEALQRIQEGTFEEWVGEIIKELKNIRRTYMRKAEEYDPDLSIAWMHAYYHQRLPLEVSLQTSKSFKEKWFKENFARVYYTTKVKYWWELPVWREEVKKTEHSIYAQELSLKNLSKEEIEEAVKDEDFDAAIIDYLWLELRDFYYIWEGDYERALYYQEKIEVARPVISLPYEASSGERGELFGDIRSKYLKQLKAKGEPDKLHPFIYLNDKPLDPGKGFTKKGEPYVAVLSFCQALNIPTEWVRKGKLLRIKKENDSLTIGNIKGQWKIYSDEGVKKINTYLKDKEIYLPLKELCQLLNLELQWDEETFIARVFKK
ncbi:hypothetical protein H5T87_09000 [bacterium]|nr:hypothetical protein [bacterium]